MKPENIKDLDAVYRWLRHGVEWNDEASRDCMNAACDVLAREEEKRPRLEASLRLLAHAAYRDGCTSLVSASALDEALALVGLPRVAGREPGSAQPSTASVGEVFSPEAVADAVGRKKCGACGRTFPEGQEAAYCRCDGTFVTECVPLGGIRPSEATPLIASREPTHHERAALFGEPYRFGVPVEQRTNEAKIECGQGACAAGACDVHRVDYPTPETIAKLRKAVVGSMLTTMHPQGPSYHVGWNAGVHAAIDAFDAVQRTDSATPEVKK